MQGYDWFHLFVSDRDQLVGVVALPIITNNIPAPKLIIYDVFMTFNMWCYLTDPPVYLEKLGVAWVRGYVSQTS